MTPDTILVKLGGSLITDKSADRSVRRDHLARTAAELVAGCREGGLVPILGHGSGSFGHPEAARHRIAEGLPAARLAGVGATQVAARRLHLEVLSALLAAGARPLSLAPSALLTTDGPKVQLAGAEIVGRAIALGLWPVVFGDVVLDQRRGVAICSTERVLEGLVRALRGRGAAPRCAFWAGGNAGVLDRSGHLVPLLDRTSWGQIEGAVGGAAETDVTGGMRLRVETCLALADLGVVSVILDGRVPGRLQAALTGESVPGTIVQ